MNLDRQNFFGIDWGEATLGLAIAHPETRIALPYGTMSNDAALLPALCDIFRKEHVGTVVVGVPQSLHGRGEPRPSERFGRELEEQCGVQVIYRNEMFTTTMAQQNLIARGETKVAERDDAEAARILLQEWLDTGEA